jgi:hypothetical protein
MDLAEPIAKRGEAVVPFLLAKLNPHVDDATVRDILGIFHAMSYLKTYKVKSDAVLMAALRTKVAAMKDAEWKRICLKTLQNIEQDNDN